MLFFERHCLNINPDKTEFIIFCKKSQNQIANNRQLKVKNEFNEQSKSAKYLCVYLDQNLGYQMEVQNILRKMATGIKVLYSIRNILPEKTRVLLLNSLVLSHFHYASVLINGISQNLRITLEKQLSWALQACFHKKEYDSSRALKLQYKILHVWCFGLESFSVLLEISKYFLLYFQHQVMTTAKLKVLDRSNCLVYDSMTNSSYLSNSFFKNIVPPWNNLPSELKTLIKFKDFFQDKFKHQIESADFDKKCWIDYRFL